MDFARHPINHGFNAARKIDPYRQMVRIREHSYWETDHDTRRAKTGRHFFDE